MRKMNGRSVNFQEFPPDMDGPDRPHDWGTDPSDQSDVMCRRCWCTGREAAAMGTMGHCPGGRDGDA